MFEITSDSVAKLPRGVRLHFDKVRQTHVLLAPERAFNIDGPAVAVLELMDGSKTVREIATMLAKTFNADPAVIEHDVIVMLRDLAGKRVVQA